MIRDLAHAWRAIIGMPFVAAVVVASLGVGIGVNTAVFSWLQAMVLQPLPGVTDASRFQLVEPRAETGSYPGASWLEYADLRERVRTLPDLLAFRMVPFNVGDAGKLERTHGLFVSGNYFSVLGLRPVLGRFPGADEVRRGGDPVMIVSYDYWRTHIGGAATAVGRTLRVNGQPLTIIGVAPARFQGTVLGLYFDLFVPATLAPQLLAGSRELEDRSQRGYSVIGKLTAGAAREQAQTDVDAAMRDLAGAFPQTNRGMQAEVLPFWQSPRGPQRMLSTALVILQLVMLMLLLAVCGNTANLMLARASARQREMGMRLALGAGRWRVASLLLTENLMLSLAGAALGAAVAVWATDALRAVPMITSVPVRFQTHVDGVDLAFAALLGVASGLSCGLGPALQLARVAPNVVLRAGARNAGRSGLRNALMGVEVGLAMVVIMTAALFVRSFGETRDTDPGFRREGVLLAAYDFTGRNANAALARDFASRLLTRLRDLPAVESAAIALSVPLDIHGLPMRSFTVEGRARSDGQPDQALSNVVTPGYFKTMGIPLRKGTDFADLSDRAAPAQAIVNEEFVRRFLSGVEPLGRRVMSRDRAYLIAGIVANSISEAYGEPPTPVVYLSYRDRPAAMGQIHLRTRIGAEHLLAPNVERTLRDLDPTLPVYDVRTLNEHVENNLFLRRIPARMFVVLGPLLLVLAAVGIYAVVAYTVSRRTSEIGVRLALGASSRQVVRQIVGESLRVIAVGVAGGWLIVFVLDLHLLRGVISLPVFAGVPLLVLAVAAFASWLPATRVTAIDPLAALRQE